MINVIIHGFMGKMGNVVCRMVNEDKELNIAAGVDPFADGTGRSFPVYKNLSDVDVKADVIIDFSTAEAVSGLVQYAEENNLPVVICTTGLSPETSALIKTASQEIPVFMSANMSLGINLLAALLKKAAPILAGSGFDIEIIEKHHNKKIDAPSGTAFLLGDAVKSSLSDDYYYTLDRSQKREKRDNKEIGMASLRGGTIVGEHNVVFAGTDEVVEFTHIAQSKEVFGAGAVNAAKFLPGMEPGLYDMSDMLKSLIG